MNERKAWTWIQSEQCDGQCEYADREECLGEDCAYWVALATLNTVYYAKREYEEKLKGGDAR